MRDPQGWRQRNIRTVKQRNGERLPEWACLADTQIGRAGVHLGEHGEEKITPNKGGPAGCFQPVLSFTVQYRNRCLNGHKKVRQKYDRTLPWTYSLFTPAEQMVLENCRLAGAIDPLGPFTRRRSLVRVQQSPPDLAYGIDAVGARPTASTISGISAGQKTRLYSIDIFPLFTDLNPRAGYIELKFGRNLPVTVQKYEFELICVRKFSTKFMVRNCNK